jgi:hypothetical protein
MTQEALSSNPSTAKKLKMQKCMGSKLAEVYRSVFKTLEHFEPMTNNRCNIALK